MTSEPLVTPAQVWYVARVYPETVTDAEAREPYEQAVTSEADRSYWEATADVLNRLADERLRAEIKTWGQIWNDANLLAARVEALRDGTADLGQLDADARQPAR